jgi:phosphate starvation-inducible PhoH-like protein
MSKKPRNNRKSLRNSDNVVHPDFEDRYDWHPLDNEIDNIRDKKFLRKVKPRSEGQKLLMQSIEDHNLTLAIGPAGTGKTYLAISSAVEALEVGNIERIILSRPAMEAGESLGYLPGDMHEKMAPYLRPLYDALGDRMGGKRVRQLIDEGTIGTSAKSLNFM